MPTAENFDEVEFERKTKINMLAQARYDELMREGNHGHYETMFRVIHECIDCFAAQRGAETQASVNAWQCERFPTATIGGVVGHLREEFNEFLHTMPGSPEAGEEAADIVLVLYCWAMLTGVNLHAEIDRKMVKNRARQWDIQPDGTGRHVKGAPPQTGGGDAPYITTVSLPEQKDAPGVRGPHGRPLVYRDGVLDEAPEETGGGDAGERDERLLADLYRRRADVYSPKRERNPYYGDDDIDLLLRLIRSSHRGGAEATREACARAAGRHIRQIVAPHSSYAGSVEDAVRALPIPGKTDAG